ncbi:MAG TPA: amino acid adenylation domain-containing protein, partial [Anaerolineales bacterium]|nr:amino acid adenylation domain-containing protein [Anaerolineales bacterium]
MPPNDVKFDISKIRAEIQKIIMAGIGANSGLRSIPDDVPILDLGISSLALVEGMRQVYDRFGVLVSIRRVIEGQITIGSLALYIEQELNSQQSLKRKSQNSQWQAERQVLLASSQQHLGFLSRYSNEANAAFNESMFVQLDGALHGPALHTAIEEVGNRYESLRTALNPDQNTLDVGKGETLELTVTPITHDLLQGYLSEIVLRPFEIGKRLFRAELLRLSETEHVLVLVGHALVIEIHALQNVLHDIAQLYQAFSHDQEAPTAPLTLQWTDYLALNKTSKAEETRQRIEDYWKDVFASGVPHLELPADHPRPPVKKYSGSRLDLKLDSATNERLLALASSEGVSLQAVLLTALAVFIHRVSGLDDLTLGVESKSLYLDQDIPAIANTRNMLPLRTRYDAGKSFREYIHTQTERLANANLHRNLSLAELIQLLNIPRDQSRSALFTTAFLSLEYSVPEFDGLQSRFIVPPSSGARYDLEFLAVTQDQTITLVCDYSTELFNAETISRWLHGIVTLLNAGLQDASQACGLLPMMSTSERETILFEWNKTEKEFPREKTTFDLIAEQARLSPEACAIRFGDAFLNYNQLIQRVEQIASALDQHGIKPGHHVGILVKRSLDLLPTMLAVWRIGAAYVPIDIGFPKQRIDYVLADSNINILVANHEFLNLLGEDYPSPILWIEDIEKQSLSHTQTPPAHGADGAIIFYTSGSTGKPKGVEIRHSALLNSLLAVKEYLEFKTDGCMLALTTTSFDISTTEIFMPLMAGGCVDLAEDGLVADGVQLMERIQNHTPSHIQMTPSSWKSLLNAGWSGQEDICLLTAGEALSRDLAEQLLQRCRALWNLYGPTETTVYSIAHHVVLSPQEPIRIGRPLPNTRIYILDKKYQPVPIGVAGDLYIAGEGVSVGYWQRPDLTAERFIPDPFHAGERMYLTGDLARYMPDGTIVCLGREDDQVKIHGVRVELAEIESALRSIEGIQDAAVVAWRDAHGDNQLVAHIITNKEISAHQLRIHLRERLPEVMIPPYMLFTDSFPKTANGKVQRMSLPSPNSINAVNRPAITELPVTDTEQALANIWASLLAIDVKVIGRDSD